MTNPDVNEDNDEDLVSYVIQDNANDFANGFKQPKPNILNSEQLDVEEISIDPDEFDDYEINMESN